MRAGGGKAKGGEFERYICKCLSHWITHGERADVFWRSAMSGGRATVQRKRGVDVRQAGDICAVAPEGNAFCKRWYIECKFVKDLGLESLIVKGAGPLDTYWEKACTDATWHKREPMIIAKQNGWPILVITYRGRLNVYPLAQIPSYGMDICLFDNWMETRCKE